jgi:glycosyltransferase involved in cell wall biosynthesis
VKKRISVVILVRNEELNLNELNARLCATIDKVEKYEWEVIAVDNDSTDRSAEMLSSFCRADRRWRLVQLSRNFTAEGSIAAGLHYATGDAVCVLVSDLQDPPEILIQFIEKWEAGSDVVYGEIRERKDGSWFRYIGAYLAYAIIYYLSDCKIPRNAGSCQIMDRKVVDALKNLPEVDRYFRGLVHWVGFRQTSVIYDRDKRKRGKSSAGILYLLGFALNAVISFSSKPLRFIWFSGLFVTFAAISLASIYLIAWLRHGSAPPGIMTLILLVLFSLGLQSFFLGIIGEYLAAVFRQSKGRPVWIVRNLVGFGSPDVSTQNK